MPPSGCRCSCASARWNRPWATPRSRSPPTPRRSGRTPARRRRGWRSRIWPTTSASGTPWSTCTARRCRQPARSSSPTSSASCCWWWRSATTRSWATVRKGGGVLPARPGDRARGLRGAGGAGAPLHPHRALARPGRDPAQEGRAAQPAPTSASAIHVQIATLWEEAIGNPDEAIAAWKDVLGDNAGSLMALRALDRLFQQQGMDLELADNLQRQLELTEDPDVTVMLLGRLGRLRQDRLEDRPGAVETYRRLLELAPGPPRHHRGARAPPAVPGAGAGSGEHARAGLPGAQRLPQPGAACWRSRPATPRSANHDDVGHLPVVEAPERVAADLTALCDAVAAR